MCAGQTTLELNFVPVDYATLGPISFIVNAAADDEAINVQINYNPEEFPKAYNELTAEIKDSLRHELEHMG